MSDETRKFIEDLMRQVDANLTEENLLRAQYELSVTAGDMRRRFEGLPAAGMMYPGSNSAMQALKEAAKRPMRVSPPPPYSPKPTGQLPPPPVVIPEPGTMPNEILIKAPWWKRAIYGLGELLDAGNDFINRIQIRLPAIFIVSPCISDPFRCEGPGVSPGEA
jgi:hypothetical protein